MKIGFFGKLPGYGDFIQRGVSPELISQWDNWMLQSLEVSNGQLGDDWQGIYFNSPIWRFCADALLFSKSSDSLAGAVTGVMMPSIDNCGRAYPFAVLCQTGQAVNLFNLSQNVDDLHAQCEDFILDLLDKKRPDLDEIANVLNQIYAPLKEYDCQDVQLTETSSVGELCRLSDNILNDMNKCHNTFLQNAILSKDMCLSIWSMAGTTNLAPQQRYYSGLPPADMFSSLLRGV